MADSLFERILGKSDVFYRHQQCNEPDLTESDKRGILDDLLTSNKALFLQRYGQYMNASDCALFHDECDPLIQFMVSQIEGRKSDAQNMKKRRYLMLQKLKEKGKYFSDEKMREREPYLFDVMVGKFMEAKDQINLRPSVSREECPEGGWANMLCQFESSREIAQRRNEHHTEWHRDVGQSQKAEHLSRMEAHVSNMLSSQEDELEEGEEGLENDFDEMREELNRMSQEDAEMLEDGMDDSPEILRREFQLYMEERFLAGHDSSAAALHVKTPVPWSSIDMDRLKE
uniref:CCD97-like_C domain-containing protein n=1 Tax=Haemonchus contortus TaxID=6289 RepID=A0A7I4YUQ4_HAECO